VDKFERRTTDDRQNAITKSLSTLFSFQRETYNVKIARVFVGINTNVKLPFVIQLLLAQYSVLNQFSIEINAAG
jgi:hypothetical protein